MIDSDEANVNVAYPVESTVSGIRPLYRGSSNIRPVTPDDSQALSSVISDIKKLNKEIREIVLLKSELRSPQLMPDKNISLPKKPVKEPEIKGNNNIRAVVRSDIEKLRDEANDISILKSELHLYQLMISKKVSLIQECMKRSNQ